MKLRVILTSLALVALAGGATGCAADAAGSAGPSSAGPEVEAMKIVCRDLTPGALTALQQGLDAGVTIDSVSATPASETSWFVVAALGADRTTAAWFTTDDPSTADAATYQAVDATAVDVSAFGQVEGLDAEAAGLDHARQCQTGSSEVGP